MGSYRFALIGNPVAKSKSPALFSVFSEMLGQQFVYDLKPCAGDKEPGETLKKLFSEKYDGFNVTVPHKIAVRSFITHETPEIKICSNINCVRFLKDSSVYSGLLPAEGCNTDFQSLMWATREKISGAGQICAHGALPWKPVSFSAAAESCFSGKTVLIIGSGGAARTSAAVFCSLGFGHIIFASRGSMTEVSSGSSVKKNGRAEEAAEKLRSLFPGTEISVIHYSVCDGKLSSAGCTCSGIIPAADIVVNATPLGMYGGEVPEGFITDSVKLVIDWPYRSGGTGFLHSARAKGLHIISGTELLLRQAVLSLHYWTGIPVDITGFLKESEREIIRRKIF